MLALGAAASLLGGCGGGSVETGADSEARAGTETTEDPRRSFRKLHLTLDGQPSPENVGILMAQRRGYFGKAGLEVEVSPPEKPFRPIEYVAIGTVDLAISHQPEVVLAKEEDQPIVAVGTLISRPTAAMIWLRKAKIENLADLKGKTIAIPGVAFQEDLLETLLGRADLTLADVEVEPVGYDLVPALISGRADAIFGGSWNVEGVELEARGLEPVITRVEDLGVPPYDELVFITRPGRLAKDPESIRDFLSAVARGNAAAIEDPKAAAKAIAGASFEGNGKWVTDGVEATLPLLSKRVSLQR